MERTGIYPDCQALTYEIIDNELRPYVQRKEWGFTMADCLRMIADHMDATADIEDRKNVHNAYLTKEKIEYVLEDCNFHTLCKMLYNENYASATKWVLEGYTEE